MKLIRKKENCGTVNYKFMYFHGLTTANYVNRYYFEVPKSIRKSIFRNSSLRDMPADL